MNKNAIKCICEISIILFVICIAIFDFSNAFSYSITVAVFLYFLYERLLWRCNPFNKTPRIYGRYKGNIESTYDGGLCYESRLTIKQTLSQITVTEETPSGVCVSIVSSLYKYNDDGQWFLAYIYLTHPQTPNHDDMHYGTSILYIKDKDTLEGFYYTNRIQQTTGMQAFKRVK